MLIQHKLCDCRYYNKDLGMRIFQSSISPREAFPHSPNLPIKPLNPPAVSGGLDVSCGSASFPSCPAVEDSGLRAGCSALP